MSFGVGLLAPILMRSPPSAADAGQVFAIEDWVSEASHASRTQANASQDKSIHWATMEESSEQTRLGPAPRNRIRPNPSTRIGVN